MILYIPIGISGCGKSTYANSLLKRDEKCMVHSSDSIRGEVYGDESCQDNPRKIFQLMRERTLKSLKEGYSVVYDATNLKRRERITFIKEVRRNISNVHIKAILFLVPPEVCIERRNSENNRKVPKEVILKQLTQFQVPYYDEGFDSIENAILYDNVKIESFLTEIIKKAYYCNQDNPHHLDTVLSHCIKVSVLMPNFEEIGLFHDLGKVYTKKYDKNMIAHYYGHENVSAYIYLFMYSGKIINKDILNCALAIEYHMRRYSYPTKEDFERWKDSLPDKCREALAELCLADMKDSISIDK